MKTIEIVEKAVRDLLLSHKVKNQKDFEVLLKKQGYNVTQSTISRILNKIEAIKTLDENGVAYYRVRPQASRYLATNLVHKIVSTETMVIVFTLGGAAGHVCEYLDQQNSPLIAGTIAGENTIFIAPHRLKDIIQIEHLIRGIFL